jgi:hypothetical protein
MQSYTIITPTKRTKTSLLSDRGSRDLTQPRANSSGAAPGQLAFLPFFQVLLGVRPGHLAHRPQPSAVSGQNPSVGKVSEMKKGLTGKIG